MDLVGGNEHHRLRGMPHLNRWFITNNPPRTQCSEHIIGIFVRAKPCSGAKPFVKSEVRAFRENRNGRSQQEEVPPSYEAGGTRPTTNHASICRSIINSAYKQ